jgi:NADH-quinone oxidoreductase subunit J
MTITFSILAILTIGGSVAAVSLRRLVHCALALTVAFGGLAALYVQLDAQFVGFSQLLVYIGAVAILIVFAILLTRANEVSEVAVLSLKSLTGTGIAFLVFGLMAWLIRGSQVLNREPARTVDVSVRQIGDQLMTKFVLPLEVIGILLTAALIGAVIIAMREPEQS